MQNSTQEAFTASASAAALKQEQAARQELQQQLQETQLELTALQNQVQGSMEVAAADAAFAAAGHPDVLFDLAKAVLKGNLKPNSRIAQRLATTGTNLCRDSTKACCFSEAEHRFFSLIRKISRQAVELWRGPMRAESTPEDFSVLTALFNDVVPGRQATQKWDAKNAQNKHF